MGDPNTNFENRANLSNEDPPPILSSGIRQVFHVFASMLDIKSFMRLAMASKKMYKRCMEDKMIRINIDEKQVAVRDGHVTNPRPFSFYSFNVADKHIENYLWKLRQLKCNVSLEKIVFSWCEVDDAIIMETRRYLEELGVKKIDSFNVGMWCSTSQHLSFIKDYHIKNVEISRGPSDDAIRSLLQLNLNFFCYPYFVQGELLLEVDTSIPRLEFPFMIWSADVFTQILWKIQTGALNKLCTSDNNIPWSSFTSVRNDFDGPLPDERPLLITTRDSPRWFLHGDGGVTICKRLNPIEFEISKCSKDDFPVLVQSKESVHKMLAEKHHIVRRIECLKRHFLSFFDGIPVLDASHEGPFPEERPLICKSSEIGPTVAYHLLNEDGSIDVYNCINQTVIHDCNDLVKTWPYIYYHTPLQKFLLDKRIQNRVTKGGMNCQSMEEFRSLFEDYETLPHDFKGQLPERRPLIFEKSVFSDEQIKDERRIVLYEDGSVVLYCCERNGDVSISGCSPWNLPSILMTLEILKKIAFVAPYENFTYSIEHNMFRDAFTEIKTLPFHTSDDLPKERPLIFKKTELHDGKLIDHRWLVPDCGYVTKCEWKDGMATFSRADPREFPFMLTKTLVTEYFEGKVLDRTSSFYIDRYTLNQCLEDCKIYDYDDVYSPADDRPLIFKKTEIKHTCQENPDDCDCIEEILHFCVVDDLQEVVHITWGAKEDRFLSFNDRPNPDDVPPAVKTREMLEYVLEDAWDPDEVSEVHWYGSFEDLVGYLEGHEMIDFNHKGPLPKMRPLVFKDDSSMRREIGLSPEYWFLRYYSLSKDNLLIKCEKKDSHVLLTINPKFGRPPAISCSP